MSFEKEKIIDELKLHDERISISKLYNFIKPLPYYRLKLEFIPELEKAGVIKISRVGKFTYIELNKNNILK